MTAGLMMASQKGPRFQVVRLPGQFTRGRWDCWDYREPDQKPGDAGVLVFDTSTPSSTTVSHPGDTPSTVPLSSVHTNPTVLSNTVSPSNSSHTIGEGTIVVTSIAQFQPNLNAQVSKPLAGPSVSAPLQPSLSASASAKNLNKLEEEASEGSSNMGLLNAGANVVAIDNKIEQAMDLVKTHLTFAVREEVETLRTTIADLEAKVTNLEQQNQMLRQYAPAEVVNNLSNILQNRSTVGSHNSVPLPSEASSAENEHPKLIRRDTAQELHP
ncbi:unnamed protein product [Bursaphelenchus okinawaensis]|uniref:TSC22 domain family protein 1 n=1 Tax=Bursaphelenchus okinawaensis TaxID=465554 RepID=A0A811LP96_9BILA|nr:unnamed protein product [Bursaphelenchus okinawaensis]CAG9126752.1 unnamed protein product [Bursaphelenchus okinawaensis]